MSNRPRILVAEDDASILDLIRVRLLDAGYEVHVARNGFEAATRIRNIRPDAVILDINMPLLDGFAVLDGMKGDPSLAHTRAMMLTARHSGDDVRRAMLLGAKDFLAKPFSETQLLSRVARLLRPKMRTPEGAPSLEA
jgi:two-component system OmpR family response regulator